MDLCPHCQGIWFDTGELTRVVRALSKSEDIRPGQVRLFEKRIISRSSVEEADRECPRCNLPMHKFNYCYDSNVFVDKCPKCEGVWTERGEVKRIAEYVKAEPQVTKIGENILESRKYLDSMKELAEMAESLRLPARGFVRFMPLIVVPLSDDQPRERFPVVTLVLVVVCAAIFLSQSFLALDLRIYVYDFGFMASRLLRLGLVTSLFLHANVFHVAGNMFCLWLFGDNVEDRFSRLGYLAFYLCCGIAANLIHAAFNWGSIIPAIGASGAVSGIMGAYVVFYPYAKVNLFLCYRVVGIPAAVFLIAWFSFQLIFAMLQRSFISSEIGFFAHVGGFLFGAMVASYKKAVAKSR